MRWGFPQIGCSFLGVGIIIRIIKRAGVYIGAPCAGKQPQQRAYRTSVAAAFAFLLHSIEL